MNECADVVPALEKPRGDMIRLSAEAELILHFYPEVSDRQIDRLRQIVAEIRAQAGQTCQHCSGVPPPYSTGPISRKLLLRLPLSVLAMFIAFVVVLLVVERFVR